MESFIGTIQMFGFNFPPRGWVLCQGQLLSINQYAAVFSVLGTSFGGNGQSNFGVPDLRSRLPVGQGQGPGLTNRVIGQAAGTETVTATIINMPNHTHTNNFAVTTQLNLAAVPSNQTNAPTPTNAYIGASTPSGPPSAAIYSDQLGVSPVPAKGLTGGLTGEIASAGGGQPMATLNPYLAVNFCLCLEGIFPSRN